MSHKVFFSVCSLLGLISAAASAQYQPIPLQYHDEYYEEYPSYNFKYKVEDDFGNDYGHEESRDGYQTTGAYYVLLPDGRTQWVRYYVTPDSGFVADVSYDGEAHYDYLQQPGPIYEGDKPHGFGQGSPAHPKHHGSAHRGNTLHASGDPGHRGHVQKVDRPYGPAHATTGYHHDRKLHSSDPHNPLFYGAKINPYTPGATRSNHGSKNRGENYPSLHHPRPHHKKPYTPGQPKPGGISALGFRNPRQGIHPGRNDQGFPVRTPSILGSQNRDLTTPDFYHQDNPVDAFDGYHPRNSIF